MGTGGAADPAGLYSTNVEPDKKPLKGANEHLRRCLSGGRQQIRSPGEFRYVVIHRISGPYEGTNGRVFAGYQWPLLSAADA